jgi:hypothetical protein
MVIAAVVHLIERSPSLGFEPGNQSPHGSSSARPNEGSGDDKKQPRVVEG